MLRKMKKEGRKVKDKKGKANKIDKEGTYIMDNINIINTYKICS